MPQGSVLGPLLFLVLIGDIDADINSAFLSSFADDTRVGKGIKTANDASQLQSELQSVYRWAHDNNMEFNGLKFQTLKYGRDDDIKESYEYVNSEYSAYIEDVYNTRDLGIIMSSDGQFTDHINKVVTKARQRGGWINRTFMNNSIEFRRSVWRTYIESFMDYGSQIFTPIS